MSRDVELIGVGFDGSARARGQAAAPAALREQGLEAALPMATVGEDIAALPASRAERGPYGFFNEAALLAMVAAVDERVGEALRQDHFPLLYGGDCASLLGAVPALREHCGRCGLMFVDAHEDATAMEASTTGEAANMEIALLLGHTGTQAPEGLRRRLPALESEALVMLGQRDRLYRQEAGVPSISKAVQIHPVAGVRQRTVVALARSVVEELDARTSAWWLHVDLDVLRAEDFPACGAARDPNMPGGLTWSELAALVRPALASDRCRGMSIVVYNTDLDPTQRSARDIVRFLADVVPD